MFYRSCLMLAKGMGLKDIVLELSEENMRDYPRLIRWEYLTTIKHCAEIGVEQASTAEPPGDFWRLKGVTTIGNKFFYYWERGIDREGYYV